MHNSISKKRKSRTHTSWKETLCETAVHLASMQTQDINKYLRDSNIPISVNQHEGRQRNKINAQHQTEVKNTNMCFINATKVTINCRYVNHKI